MIDPLAETQIPEEADELIDTVVADKYRVVRRIGKGGFGAVYEVRHVELPKRFAMKVLLPELSARADVVRRFRNEAMAASAIGHEHIVEVIDLGVLPSKSHYLLLEFLEGQDFSHLIEREGPLSLGRTARIMTQVCEALVPAHEKGIVHRDLKPENIFLLSNRRQSDFVKLLDFGISKLSDELKGGIETESHVILGTPYFMAPEQLNASKNVDARADLYSLGVILYRALTGQFPFGGASFGAIVVEVMTQPIPDVRASRPDLPEELTRIVEGLLAKSRDDRTPDCKTLLAQLAPYLTVDAAPVSVVHDPIALAPTQTASKPLSSTRAAPPTEVPALNDSTAATTAQARAPRKSTATPWMLAAVLSAATVAAAIGVANRSAPTSPSTSDPSSARAEVPQATSPAPMLRAAPPVIVRAEAPLSTVASSNAVADAGGARTSARRTRVGRELSERTAPTVAASSTVATQSTAMQRGATPSTQPQAQTTTQPSASTTTASQAVRRPINLDDPPPSSIEGSP